MAKRASIFFIFALILSPLLSLFHAPVAIAADVNLIENPSVETASADPSLPQGWNISGANNRVTFSYLQSGGYNSAKSLKVSTRPNAKGNFGWVFNPVSVSPATSYTYSDYYIGSSSTLLLKEYNSNDQLISSRIIASINSSSGWNKASASFTTNASASKVTIIHQVGARANLQTDNFSLVAATITPPPPPPPPPPNGVNIVPNPSMEVVDPATGNTPQSWHTGNWGTNSAGFAYLDTGHSGSHSAKVTMSSYSNGDAKWYFDPQTVTPNTRYYFSDWSMGNGTSGLYAVITSTTGQKTYLDLGDNQINSSWSQINSSFVTPSNAASVTIYHVLASVGEMTVDDYYLSTTPPNVSASGFNRGIVSLTFDDGWASFYTSAMPLLAQYNTSATAFIVTSFLGTAGYMTGSQVKDAFNNGHEIGSHTVTHSDLTTLSSSNLNYELSYSQSYLQNLIGAPVRDFASPYGAYNSTVLSAIQNYYQSHRTVDDGYNAKNGFNAYALKTKSVVRSTTAAEVQSWIEQAQLDHSWLILVYHQIDYNSKAIYGTTPDVLSANLAAIQSSGIAHLTINQAMAEIAPQL